MKTLDTIDRDHRSPGAADVRTHLDQQVGQILNLGFLGGVFNRGGAVGQNCRHQQCFCGSHAWTIQNDGCTRQSVAAALDASRDDAVFNTDVCPQRFESTDVLDNGTSADSTTTGQRHPGVTQSSKK